MRRIRLPAPPPSNFWHLHAHSHFSAGDAIGTVQEMVDTAAMMRQPALALTEHGNMAGSVQLYKACKKVGMLPFPGEEFYIKRDAKDKDASRFHVGIVAFTTEGYETLVQLSSHSHTRKRFHHKPHIDFTDLAELSQAGLTRGLALTTGCYFGMVQQALVHQGYESAKWMVQTYASWFPHTFVELQHHNIYDEEHDDDLIVSQLHQIAQELGLPTVITQDAHYCGVRDKAQHETLKRLVSWGPDSDDAVFPGDSFHLADERYVKGHYTQDVWEDGIEGLTYLLEQHNLIIPALETYHYNVPIVTIGDPLDELEDLCVKACDDIAYQQGRTGKPRYEERLAEELDVVKATNMAGYLMLNKEICDWMDSQGIFYEARGSASGSLICYLLGITQLDPIKEKLRYERFLSKDRTKPPDIDLDVEDTRRGEVIEMLAQQFNTCQIGTWAKYSVDKDTGRGSLFVAYISRRRKDGASPQSLAHIDHFQKVPLKDREEIYALDKHETLKSYGTHAGGIVITSTKEEFETLVPTMLVASSDTTVTQYGMDDVEDLGLLKEDILGQTSLTVMRRCMEFLGRDPKDGWDWIPLKDTETFRNIRKQDVDGVFQLEGWTCKKGCRELRPKNMKDLMILVSIYRPATIDTGIKDKYIQRRAGWEKAPQLHPILEKHLKETHGLPVLQDQVISVLRDIGFTPEHLTSFLKAVKASNENIGGAAQVIQGYAEMFKDLATEAGFSSVDLKFTWEAIEGFSKYGFNRAHATTYARRAWRMAYLKTHHPLEFHAALLQTWAGTPKEKEYILATRDAGISIMSPDVNISGHTYTIDRKRNAIRKGLVSIKGVGEKAAAEIASHAPFTDITDLINRCDARAVNGGKNYARDNTLNGVLKKLQDAKALRSLNL